jgi:hypothetical protein
VQIGAVPVAAAVVAPASIPVFPAAAALEPTGSATATAPTPEVALPIVSPNTWASRDLSMPAAAASERADARKPAARRTADAPPTPPQEHASGGDALDPAIARSGGASTVGQAAEMHGARPDRTPPATRPAPAVAPDAAGATPAAADRKAVLRASDTPPNKAPLPEGGAVMPDSPVLPTALAAAPASATKPAVEPGRPVAEAAQLAPAILTLAKAPDGAQQMTVRLHPVELGMVQVRIDRAVSGMTQIEIIADKPETLQALRRDQPALHRTLDEAGIPAAGRTVTFHAAESAPAASAGTGSGHGQAQHGFAGRANGADGSANGGRGGYPSRDTNRGAGGRPTSLLPAAVVASRPAGSRTHRAGLDITA